ncbi:hypothetical protein GGR51DRAFT_543158 [Nemania sp. FL0031]|nr:hypothetical protein GGR51DRAFT_543158 [Nemania sp. FL0031]
MTLTAGAHLVRVQPALTVYHGLHRGTPSASALPLQFSLNSRRKHTNSHIASIRSIYPQHASQPHHRYASTSSKPPQTSTSTTSPTPKKPPPSAPPPSPLSDPLNPPSTTRPPPLDLPVRDAATTSLFKHLLRLGKTYTTFYKTGLLAVFANRRLLRSTTPTPTPTRSYLLLRSRVQHDISRLPIFGLIMLICGEFTPLIVILFPRLTPYTCRIPKQTAVIQQSTESRRAASFRALSYVLPAQLPSQSSSKSPSPSGSSGSESAAAADPDAAAAAVRKYAPGHICRSLALGSPLWDKLGFDVPFARARADAAISRIVDDDALLRKGGGVRDLVDEEVVLACEDRGIDTRDKKVEVLRRELWEWLVKSTPIRGKGGEREVAAHNVRLLLLRAEWPRLAIIQ